MSSHSLCWKAIAVVAASTNNSLGQTTSSTQWISLLSFLAKSCEIILISIYLFFSFFCVWSEITALVLYTIMLHLNFNLQICFSAIWIQDNFQRNAHIHTESLWWLFLTGTTWDKPAQNQRPALSWPQLSWLYKILNSKFLTVRICAWEGVTNPGCPLIEYISLMKIIKAFMESGRWLKITPLCKVRDTREMATPFNKDIHSDCVSLFFLLLK